MGSYDAGSFSRIKIPFVFVVLNLVLFDLIWRRLAAVGVALIALFTALLTLARTPTLLAATCSALVRAVKVLFAASPAALLDLSNYNRGECRKERHKHPQHVLRNCLGAQRARLRIQLQGRI